jgi:hypothetical protein
MSIPTEHNEAPAYSRDDVVQLLIIAAIAISGLAVIAAWLYYQW